MDTRIVAVGDAVGLVLSHDLTRIVPGEFKGPAFKKGHVIRPGDVDLLRDMGKEHIYVLELEAGEVHEDEAGIRLGQAVAGRGIACTPPRESRVNLVAAVTGLLKVDVNALEEVNDLPEVVLATLPNNTAVREGEMVGGTKVIPLVVRAEVLEAAEGIATDGVVSVVPYKPTEIGLVVTGHEVYQGRIIDRFQPLMAQKAALYGSRLAKTVFTGDDASRIAAAIRETADLGAGLILVSGGMSVDPDDVTPQGIRLSGASIEKYGAPVLPGAMFLLAYLEDIPVLGVPASAIYFQTTVLDLVLPRLLTGEHLTRRDINRMGHGGLCRNCPECRFPHCGFGRGGR
ncbi:MAG TPA: molybdopterin-binding protein [Spirochaetia bacterium]|nr:molybdopterin-binding protein [Spirochaetia bacterium]